MPPALFSLIPKLSSPPSDSLQYPNDFPVVDKHGQTATRKIHIAQEQVISKNKETRFSPNTCEICS